MAWSVTLAERKKSGLGNCGDVKAEAGFLPVLLEGFKAKVLAFHGVEVHEKADSVHEG